MRNRTLLLGITLLLHGCAHAISPELAGRADRTFPFEHFLSDPDLYVGKLVILGGVIEQVMPEAAGTLIEVAQKPLDYWDQPQRTRRTGGRFLLYHARKLDPLLYAPGREITAAAEVAGTRPGILKGREFTSPLLVVRELKLWGKPVPASGAPQWRDPLYDRQGQPGRPE